MILMQLYIHAALLHDNASFDIVNCKKSPLEVKKK